MNTKYDKSTKQKDKTNHYKTKLRDCKDKNQILQSNNTKLKQEISQLSDDNKNLKSTIENLKNQMHELEISKETEQKEEKKQKYTDKAIRIIYYIGEIIIYTSLLYGSSTNTIGDSCVFALVVALILVLIYLILHIIAGYKITSLFSPFIVLIIDMFQSFFPVLVASIILFIKQDSSFFSFLNSNSESTAASAIIVLSVIGLMFVTIVVTILILCVIHFAINQINKSKSI